MIPLIEIISATQFAAIASVLLCVVWCLGAVTAVTASWLLDATPVASYRSSNTDVLWGCMLMAAYVNCRVDALTKTISGIVIDIVAVVFKCLMVVIVGVVMIVIIALGAMIIFSLSVLYSIISNCMLNTCDADSWLHLNESHFVFWMITFVTINVLSHLRKRRRT